MPLFVGVPSSEKHGQSPIVYEPGLLYSAETTSPLKVLFAFARTP